MRRTHIGLLATWIAMTAAVASAQGRGGGAEWPTAGGDAQRASWIRSDAAVSADALAKGGFELQWKTKLDERGRQTQAFGQGLAANGVTLFTPLSVVTGVSNNVYALDNDTGNTFWQKRINAPLPAAGTPSCPGGITGAATRTATLAPATPSPPRAGGPGGGRGYQSLVGEPGEGAPTLQRGGGPGGAAAPGAGAGAGRGREGAPAAGAAPPAPPARGGGGGFGGAAVEVIPGMPAGVPAGAGSGFGRVAGVTYVIAGDGTMYTLSLFTGKEMQRPALFVPANARVSDPIAVNDILYVTTTGRCAGVPDGVWAMDLSVEGKPVVSWKTNGGSPIGAVAFTPNGALVATIGGRPRAEGAAPSQTGASAAAGYANVVVALDPRTLQLKDWFAQSATELVSAPVVFKHGDKDLVAVATKSGRILLLDASSLGGANHSTPLYASQPIAGAGPAFAPDAMAVWQELSGTRWLLVPAGGITALKVADSGGKPSLQPGWTSRPLVSPSTPIVVNGVVFAVATGSRAVPATAFAFDGTTGKELWTSGRTMTSFMTGRSFWSGTGQIYVGTGDGTVYAFGFAMERK